MNQFSLDGARVHVQARQQRFLAEAAHDRRLAEAARGRRSPVTSRRAALVAAWRTVAGRGQSRAERLSGSMEPS